MIEILSVNELALLIIISVLGVGMFFIAVDEK